MRKRIFAALLAMVMVLGLAACGGSTESTGGEAKETSEEAKESTAKESAAKESAAKESTTEASATEASTGDSGEKVFTTAVNYIPETFYPSYFSDEFTTMSRGIWDPLYYPLSGKIEYYLVDDIKMSEDGLTYTFHMNEDATWSDGKPITADDVFFTLEAVKLWEDVYSSSYRFVGGEEVQFNQIDERTFEAVLPSPSGMFLREFSLYFKLMPAQMFDGDPAAAVKSEKFASKDVITSGAYTVSEINEDSFVLVKREDFYRGTPQVDKLVYRLLGQGVTQAAAFESGDISYMRISSAADLEKYSSDPNYSITSISESKFNYLQFNYVNFEDRLNKDARKAICLALNGDEIIMGAYGSTELAQPATSVICPDFTVYRNQKGYEQNLEEAKKLAESSGLTGIELNYVYCNERSNMEEVATMVQAQLAQIGVKVNVKGYDYSTFSDIEYSGEKDWDMLTNGLDSMRGDGLPDMGFLTNEWNVVGWSDEVISLAKQVNAEPDAEKAAELAQQLHEAVQEDYVIYPISWPNTVIAAHKNITGLDSSAIVPEFVDMVSIKVE